MSRYDSIIIGAGHNALVCANYLAQRGQNVVVFEAADVCGGLGANREFHPGFRTSVAQTVSHFSTKIADDLKLAAHGYNGNLKSMATVGLDSAGQHIVVDGSSVSGAGSDDADAFQNHARQMRRFAKVLKPFWFKTMPRIGNNSLTELLTFAQIGLGIRRMGRTDMQELLRVASLPARDLMDENFDNELLKATLCWDGLVGARLAPRSPNGAVLAMLYRMAGDSNGAHTIPSGGVDGLIQSLRGAAQAAGVEIRTNSTVERVLIDGDAEGLTAAGVQLADGEKLLAKRVISSADPKSTFLNLVGVQNLDIGFTNRIRRLRCDGYVGKLHLALNGEPNFTGLDRPDNRMIIAPNMDAIEFAFDHAKYGECSADPVLEIVVPSLHDASLAPDGQHVLSANVMYVPYALKGGWTAAAREQIRDKAIDAISRYAPDIRRQIIHSEFLTPADLERDYRVSGGHWHHTEFAFDQMLMMRPTYEAAQYRTPIPGLFLCGAGCHPGGGLMGAAGHNAAREIFK